MAKIKRVFEQIEETIERDALQLSPGEFLPSEMQYSRTLAVSRLTVRKAVDGLVRSGLVQRIPGKGLMVAEAHAAPEQKRLLLLNSVEAAFTSRNRKWKLKEQLLF